MDNVIKLLKAHRSIREYLNRPVSQKLLESLIEAGQCAATSSFIQACTVIQVSNQETRQKLCEYSAGQVYVANAPVFLVFCVDMNRHRLSCDMHDAPMLSGYTEQFLTAALDCALFAQNVLVGAEAMGLGGCYIGAIRNHIAEVDKLLGLPELVCPVFGLCLGYPAQNPEIKPRLPLSVVFKQESYDDSSDAALIRDYDQTIREYYRTRSGSNKDDSWSVRISSMLAKEARPHMLPYLKSKGYLLK
ncbi:oxygen-insensitive NADPH nitroreductase [Geopsychrobacter electrodiphilus]|uniref:oxygen-insensitive NADPH nitroreductase n=1 Tax=Geopsychrobacter electrodiphilus TaxID=225196 RepID=UPI0003713505|nr:oxygen-insensitive NADPH nitroreductase [Geopsychrobacter electrodiphilus]